MNKFLYVFSEDMKNVLISENYVLLKNDTQNNIYVFENKPEKCFLLDNTGMSYILSNTLTF